MMKKEDYKILYIDDEKRNLDMFHLAFKREYNIFVSESAKEALDILKKEGEIPLIITDQRMPEMTGIEFLSKIVPEYPDTIKMILTGFTDIEALIEAINTGRVYRYIVKPWNKEELNQTIKRAFEAYYLSKENKKLIIELNQKNSELMGTLNDLKLTQERLIEHEKKAVVGELAAGLAHEVKNQLNAISFLDLIMKKIPDTSEAEKEYAKYIYDSRDRMVSLMNEIRGLAKNEESSFSLESLDINKTINEAVYLSKMDADVKTKIIEVHSDYEGKINHNKNKIIQILLNLIRNAAHAMENNVNGKISISIVKQDTDIKISIADNGTGIEKDRLDKIWDSFYSTKGEKGTGLGLGICKRIVEGHKGTIHCESEYGMGTTFSFTLPLRMENLTSL